VDFASLDGKTTLKGYLFFPTTPGPWPAVVMMHGRAGPYSAAAKGVYDASTLSLRHLQWGRFWAERGYLALHVDSFGPRGYPQGFPIGSYSRRPAEVDEQRVRPLDAYGALAWLRTRDDVIKDRIGLQGWSNGAMAALAILDQEAPGISAPNPGARFSWRAHLLPGV
jgi:dienelactone hydrolase